MDKPESPQTVRDVVKLLGGHNAVAGLFEVSVPAVSNWIAADEFPARLHLRIVRACEAAGVKYDPSQAAQ